MVVRHDKYYFEDGNVVFQVGDWSNYYSALWCPIIEEQVGEALFRIHKRLSVGSESSAFASMFSLPQSQNIEGQTDERPIVLNGDSPEEFGALMRILYPP